jgi:hypothetical protein
MWGGWECEIILNPTSEQFQTVAAEAHFCIESTGPSEVLLSWDGGSSLTVNANDSCKAIEAASVLGRAGGDLDVFDLPGRAGERLRVRLDRDGTAGGKGEVATLMVEGKSGAALARKTGRLPLTLDVTLVDGGVVLMVAGAQAGSGDAYRGSYLLSVRPGGKVGERLLRPRTNVEP